MKNAFSAFFCLLLFSAAAQIHTAVLKHPLNGADSAYLVRLAKEAIDYGGAFTAQYVSGDLSGGMDSKPDKPFSPAAVEKLRKKLKGDCEDAAVYYDIAMQYLAKFDNDSGKVYLEKALYKALERVQLKPDSASAYFALGNVYYRMGEGLEQSRAYEKGLQLDPADTLYRFDLPGFYLSGYDRESADRIIRQNMELYPDNPKTYSVLPLYYFYQGFMLTQHAGYAAVSERFVNKPVQEAIDMSLVQSAYEKHRSDKKFRLLYNLSLLNAEITKIMITSQLDTLLQRKSFFLVDRYDSAAFAELHDYFAAALQDPAMKNKYLLNKCLGYIEMVSNHSKAAVPYFQQAIRERPVNKGTYDVNCAADYDNLAGAWLMAGDTVAYERTVKEKVSLKPSINPNPSDYVTLAKIAFNHKEYAEAQKNAQQALSIFPSLCEAYNVLAAIHIINGDNNEALNNLNKSFRANKNDLTTLYLSGICLLFLQDPGSAYQCFVASKNGDVDLTKDKEVINYFFNVN